MLLDGWWLETTEETPVSVVRGQVSAHVLCIWAALENPGKRVCVYLYIYTVYIYIRIIIIDCIVPTTICMLESLHTQKALKSCQVNTLQTRLCNEPDQPPIHKPCWIMWSNNKAGLLRGFWSWWVKIFASSILVNLYSLPLGSFFK
jgi:hypothetical protein